MEEVKKFKSTVYRLRDGYATIIPKKLAEEMNIEAGKLLIWKIENDKIVIRVLEI